jgi:hypothetical protein
MAGGRPAMAGGCQIFVLVRFDALAGVMVVAPPLKDA